MENAENPAREHVIFHVDVNSAFLSWTAVDRLRRDPQRSTGSGPRTRSRPP